MSTRKLVIGVDNWAAHEDAVKKVLKPYSHAKDARVEIEQNRNLLGK